ncbi:MAG: helix-hairpin-helix domain-containing protein [Bacteroidales bacterium]|nr:helix-hairpin-helix domain-containing protein [Bacteroidales bacterium]
MTECCKILLRFSSKSLILTMILLIHYTIVRAQEPEISPSGSQKMEEALEDHAEASESEYDYTDLFAELEYFLTYPLPVNIATFDELRQLFFLNDLQINNLLKYISDYGKIVSIYELAYIDGFDREVISMLKPFITFIDTRTKARITPRQAFKYGRNQLFVRYQQLLETQLGFSPIEDSLLIKNPNQRYLGSPFKLYTRYAYNYYNRVRWGFTAEKDPGEEFFKGSQKNGFDFYSGFVFVKGNKFLREIIIGDYHLQFGQGLTLWTSYSFGKTSDVTSIRKTQRGIKPNTSVNENQFLRGSAVTFGYKRFTFTAFGSHKKIDATISKTDSISGKATEVSALLYTGLHRIPRELNNQHSISETLFGGRASFTGTRFQAGLTFYNMKLSANLEPSAQLYNKFYFRGNENHALGADILYLFRGGQLFGEISRSASGGSAILVGTSLFPSPRLVLSGIYRKYDKNYQNLYNAPFAESSNAGENGLFLGMYFMLAPGLNFSGYVDHFRFQWLRFRVNAPSQGKEYSGELTYSISRTAEIRLKYRYKQREQNLAGNEKITSIYPYEKQSLRFHISYMALPQLTMRNRFERVINIGTDKVRKNGYLIYQDVIWKPVKLPFSLTTRYALFDTDSFDERIYAYENDILYAFSVPAYYYKGSRVYLLLNYKVSKHFECWLRYSRSWFSNVSSLGSGLDEISGNTRSELKAQIRFKF